MTLAKIEALVRAVPLICDKCLETHVPMCVPHGIPNYQAIARTVAEAWEREQKLTQVLADEKCKWFLERADAAEIRLTRADGALADAATVPTGDIERGIRLLTEQRDAAEARVAALREALRNLYALVEEGWLVRNTTNDGHYPSYLSESARLVGVLRAVDAALAEPPQPKEGER